LERLGNFGSENSFEQKGTKEKDQATTSKLQRTSNNQTPTLDLETWSFSGAWLLGFGAFQMMSSKSDRHIFMPPYKCRREKIVSSPLPLFLDDDCGHLHPIAVTGTNSGLPTVAMAKAGSLTSY
jgi:hypothetical protein